MIELPEKERKAKAQCTNNDMHRKIRHAMMNDVVSHPEREEQTQYYTVL